MILHRKYITKPHSTVNRFYALPMLFLLFPVNHPVGGFHSLTSLTPPCSPVNWTISGLNKTYSQHDRFQKKGFYLLVIDCEYKSPCFCKECVNDMTEWHVILLTNYLHWETMKKLALLYIILLQTSIKMWLQIITKPFLRQPIVYRVENVTRAHPVKTIHQHNKAGYFSKNRINKIKIF